MVHSVDSPGAPHLLSSLSSPYIPLGVLYLVQGFPYGLQSGLLPVLLRTQGLSLSHIGLTRVLYLPWLLKVLWSPLVDGLWSRRTWLLLCTGGLCACCLLCSMLPPGTAFTSLAWLLLLMHILSSMQDVALDAVTVAVLTQEQVGLGNSLQVVAYKLGSVLAGGGALTLLDMLGWRMVFLFLSVGYLLATLCAWWAKALKGEEPASQENSKETRRKLSLGSLVWSVFRVPGTTWTIIYVLIYKLGEQGSLSMVPLLLLDYGVSPAELGIWNGILALMASIVGSTLGGMVLGKGRSIKSLLGTVLSLRLSCLVLQTLLLSALGKDTSLVKVCLLLSVVVQHFLAGVVTTVTFTLMMHCTRQARPSIQRHYPGMGTAHPVPRIHLVHQSPRSDVTLLLDPERTWTAKRKCPRHTGSDMDTPRCPPDVNRRLRTGAFTSERGGVSIYLAMDGDIFLALFSLQASHYSLLSSLEVLGKVSFSAVSGILVDSLGVSVSFSVFIALSCLPLLHLLNLPPTLP